MSGAGISPGTTEGSGLVVADVLRDMLRSSAFVAWKREKERTHRNNYRALFESGAMEPLVEFLAQPEIRPGSIMEIKNRTSIPVPTLRGWRQGLRRTPPRRPYEHPMNFRKLALSLELQQVLADIIMSCYIRTNRYCPGTVVQILAQQLYLGTLSLPDFHANPDALPAAIPAGQAEEEEAEGEAEDEDEDGDGDDDQSSDDEEIDIKRNDDEFLPPGEPTRREFRASRHWRQKFFKRFRLSLRKPHPKRRPREDPAAVEAHRKRMDDIFDKYPRDHIINMDETSWKLINHGFLTVAVRGSETVNCYFSGDPKMCLTAIAAVDAAGGKLPLWMLCRGKTPRCEATFRADPDIDRAVQTDRIFLSHAESGWTTETVACDYLRWLRGRYGTDPIALIWDVFASHRCPNARALAQQLDIRLEFIPAGKTADCQPLDRRIFGNVKSQARSRFDRLWANNKDPTMKDSILILLTVWTGLAQDAVLDAWETEPLQLS